MLLIAPEGIEMRIGTTNKTNDHKLLIAPEGIEIRQEDDRTNTKYALNRTRRN